MDRSSKEKLSRETMRITKVMNYTNLKIIYRTFHPNTKEYTFFSTTHGTYYKIDHIICHKPRLNRNKKLK
jgi:exonuclease III